MADASAPSEDHPVAHLVRYSGSVQGVGFRVTTVGMARKYAVAGYVRNLADGRVELYAEGRPQAVRDLLQEVRTYWMRCIDKELIEERTPQGVYYGFDIAR
jgi:acylphosphatase